MVVRVSTRVIVDHDDCVVVVRHVALVVVVVELFKVPVDAVARVDDVFLCRPVELLERAIEIRKREVILSLDTVFLRVVPQEACVRIVLAVGQKDDRDEQLRAALPQGRTVAKWRLDLRYSRLTRLRYQTCKDVLSLGPSALDMQGFKQLSKTSLLNCWNLRNFEGMWNWEILPVVVEFVCDFC